MHSNVCVQVPLHVNFKMEKRVIRTCHIAYVATPCVLKIQAYTVAVYQGAPKSLPVLSQMRVSLSNPTANVVEVVLQQNVQLDNFVMSAA